MSSDLNAEKPKLLQMPFPEDSSRWKLNLRSLIAFVFVIALGCWFCVMVGLPIAFGCLLVLAALVAAVFVVLTGRRSTRREALIRTLAIAMSRGVPLAPAIEAVAENSGGRFRRKLRYLAQELDRGVSLPIALAKTPGVLPRDVELMVRVGWETGTLDAVLQSPDLREDALAGTWRGILGQITYLVGVMTVLQFVASFMFYFILPKILAISADFGIQLPPVTQALVSVGDGAGIPLGLMTVAAWGLLPIAFFGWTKFRVPMIDRLLFRRHTALVLRCLAWVVEGGKPLPWGFQFLAEWYPAKWVRNRLARVGTGLSQGEHWLSLMHAEGLIRNADGDLLESAKRVGNLPWAMREAASAAERRLGLQLQVILQILTPLVVFTLAVVVGVIGLGFMMPLVSLIRKLT